MNTTILKPSIQNRIGRLNPDEIAVIEDVIDACLTGLEVGRKVYGPLDLASDTRDFTAEANAEQRDGLLYQAMDRVRRSR